MSCQHTLLSHNFLLCQKTKKQKTSNVFQYDINLNPFQCLDKYMSIVAGAGAGVDSLKVFIDQKGAKT